MLFIIIITIFQYVNIIIDVYNVGRIPMDNGRTLHAVRKPYIIKYGFFTRFLFIYIFMKYTNRLTSSSLSG